MEVLGTPVREFLDLGRRITLIKSLITEMATCVSGSRVRYEAALGLLRARKAVMERTIVTAKRTDFTEEEIATMEKLKDDFWSLESDLQYYLVPVARELEQLRADQRAAIVGVANRPHKLKLGDGEDETSSILQNFIGYAGAFSELQDSSSRALVLLEEALRTGQKDQVQKLRTQAKNFCSREYLLASLLRRKKLVAAA